MAGTHGQGIAAKNLDLDLSNTKAGKWDLGKIWAGEWDLFKRPVIKLLAELLSENDAVNTTAINRSPLLSGRHPNEKVMTYKSPK